jgi:multiple sugar transport system permease protein
MGTLSLFVGVVFAVVFSYYIYKGYVGSGIFKIFLFLPSMVSSVVLIMIFKKFIDAAIPEMFSKLFGMKVTGLLSNSKTQLGTIMFYTLFVGFGTQVMMYSGAMSGISPSIIEAAELDGCKPFSEFIYIVVPSVFGTIQTFVVVTVATVFTNQIGLFSFYGSNAGSANPKLTSVGYYLFKQVYDAQMSSMPKLAAFDICLTFVSIPITYLVKFLLNKFGPSDD